MFSFKRNFVRLRYADDAAGSTKKIIKVRVVLEKVVTRQGVSLRHLYEIIYEYEDQKYLEDPPLSEYFIDFLRPLFQHPRKPRKTRNMSILEDLPLASAPSTLF